MKVYFLRHGESKAQTEEEYSLDSNLSDLGVEQSRAAGTFLSDHAFDIAFVSPLRRTRQTFEHSNLCSKKIIFDSRIVEYLPAGMYRDNLLPYEEMPEYGRGDQYDAWEMPFDERCQEFINDLIDIQSDECKSILIVGHGGLFSNLLSMLLHGCDKAQFKTANCGVHCVEIAGKGELVIHYLNHSTHLN